MKKRKIAALLALACICSIVMGTGCTTTDGTQKNGGGKPFSAEFGKTIPERLEAKGSKGSEEDLVEKNADNIRKFAAESSAKIFPEVEGNYLYSPASLYMGLQLCGSITAENSAEDLMGLLGVNDREELRLSGNALIRDLSSEREGAILKIGNSIWINAADDSDLPENGKTVLSDSAKALGADIYHVPLMESSTQDLIGSWISERTNHMIEGMPVEPDANTGMILLNTLYFDKKWRREVFADEIEQGMFYLPAECAPESDPGSLYPVYISRIRYDMTNHPYVRTENATASAVYYKDSSYVIFIKPDSDEVFETVMTEDLKDVIDAYATRSYVGRTTSWEVQFGIPKLDYEVKTGPLEYVIKDMGVSSIFESGSFAEIDPTLYVSRIAQSCRIIMDENGTKAAAVTEIIEEEKAGPEEEPEVVDMILDHEYAYVIMSSDGIPLFIGAVRDPR